MRRMMPVDTGPPHGIACGGGFLGMVHFLIKNKSLCSYQGVDHGSKASPESL
jgi:hypothetical protein